MINVCSKQDSASITSPLYLRCFKNIEIGWCGVQPLPLQITFHYPSNLGKVCHIYKPDDVIDRYYTNLRL